MPKDEASCGARAVSAVNIEKPLLYVEEQIEHLKSKGITFELCTEEQAAPTWLTAHTSSSWLPIASYSKGASAASTTAST